MILKKEEVSTRGYRGFADKKLPKVSRIVVKETKKVPVVSVQDLILVKSIINTYKVFMHGGSVVSNCTGLAKIIIKLDPSFFFDFEFKNRLEKYEFTFNKLFKIFSPRETLKSKIMAHRNKNQGQAKRAAILVKNFMLQKEAILQKSKEFEIFRVLSKSPPSDFINRKYICLHTRQVYCYDAIEICKGCVLTLLTDHASKIIVKFLITIKMPTTNQVTSFFDSFFTDELVRRCCILHLDRSGINLDIDFRSYCLEKGLRLSYTIEKNRNQNAESVNGTIKKMLTNGKRVRLGPNLTFLDLPLDIQNNLITYIVAMYNNSKPCSKKSILNGFSRLLVDESKEFIRSIRPDFVDENCIMASSEANKGAIIRTWNHCAVAIFELFHKKEWIEQNIGIDLNLLLDETCLLKIQDLSSSLDQRKIDLFKDDMKVIDNGLGVVLKEYSSNIEKGVSASNFLRSINNIFTKLINKSKTHEQREFFQLLMNLVVMDLNYKIQTTNLLNENNTLLKENNSLLRELLKETKNNSRKLQFENTCEHKKNNIYKTRNQQYADRNNSLLNDINTLLSDLTKRDASKINSVSLESKIKYSILAEDFFRIIQYVETMSSNEFLVAKYAIAHVIMKVTGMKVGNLKYVNLEQLNNFINREEMCILQVGYRKVESYLNIPFVKEMEIYRKIILKHVLFMNNCLKNENPNLSIPNYGSSFLTEKLKSEIFGELDRAHLNKTINSQLDAVTADLSLKVKLTSESYRRGIALLVIKLLGLNAAKYLLGVKTFRCTKYNIDNYPNKECLQEILSAVHSVHNIANGVYIKYSFDENSSLVQHLEKL